MPQRECGIFDEREMLGRALGRGVGEIVGDQIGGATDQLDQPVEILALDVIFTF